MRYSSERTYKPCTWCDRPFRVWPHVLKQRKRGKFCSHPCYAAAWQAFSKALREGRLEGLLAPERARAKAERLAAALQDSEGYAQMERRYARHLPSQE